MLLKWMSNGALAEPHKKKTVLKYGIEFTQRYRRLPRTIFLANSGAEWQLDPTLDLALDYTVDYTVDYTLASSLAHTLAPPLAATLDPTLDYALDYALADKLVFVLCQ
jgi:hypothetical protein